MAEDDKPEVKDQKCILECPKCHKKWAELTFAYEAPVMPEDVRVLDGSKTFADGDKLECTLCGYVNTNWDLILAIAAQIPQGENNAIEEVHVQGPGDTGSGQL